MTKQETWKDNLSEGLSRLVWPLSMTVGDCQFVKRVQPTMGCIISCVGSPGYPKKPAEPAHDIPPLDSFYIKVPPWLPLVTDSNLEAETTPPLVSFGLCFIRAAERSWSTVCRWVVLFIWGVRSWAAKCRESWAEVGSNPLLSAPHCRGDSPTHSDSSEEWVAEQWKRIARQLGGLVAL